MQVQFEKNKFDKIKSREKHGLFSCYDEMVFHIHAHNFKRFHYLFNANPGSVNMRFYVHNTTLLHEALSASNCCERIIYYLLENGANVNKFNGLIYNESPFHKFLSSKCKTPLERMICILKSLLYHGADIELCGGSDRLLKPFEYCLMYKHIHYIYELLECNVDVYYPDQNGNLFLCSDNFQNMDLDVQIDLIKKCYINLEMRNCRNESLVQIFSWEHNTNTLNLILRFDVALDYKDDRFLHYLIYLKARRKLDIVKTFYEIIKRNPDCVDEMSQNTNYVNLFENYLLEMKLMQNTMISEVRPKKRNMTYFQFLSTSLLSQKIRFIKERAFILLILASRVSLWRKFPLFTSCILEKTKFIEDRFALFDNLDRRLKTDLGAKYIDSIYNQTDLISRDIKFRIFSSFFANESCVPPKEK